MRYFSFRYPKNTVTDMLLSMVCIFVITLILQNGETVYLSAVSNNNDDRVDFLYENGWRADPSSEVLTRVRIPDEFDDTFEEYNVLQKQQGFDLSVYAGKDVERYTYKLKEFDGYRNPDNIYATLYVFDNSIIAADIYCSAIDGFMMGVINYERTDQNR